MALCNVEPFIIEVLLKPKHCSSSLEPGSPQITPWLGPVLDHSCHFMSEHSFWAILLKFSLHRSFYCSFIFHVAASLSSGCFNFQADLTAMQCLSCIRAGEAVSGGIMFSCCFLSILKMTHMLSPAYKVNVLFVYFPVLFMSCNRLDTATIV